MACPFHMTLIMQEVTNECTTQAWQQAFDFFFSFLINSVKQKCLLID